MKQVGLEYITRGQAEFFQSLQRGNSLLQGFVGQLNAAAGQTTAFGSVVSGIFHGIGQQVAATFQRASSAAQGWINSGIQMNASMEQTEVAFTTLLGSAEQAGAFLEELRQFSAATPFEFPELADASRRLLAFKFAAEDIVPMMTSIGDAVGALGGGSAEIQRVVFGLGQMQAKGRVANEELMQLAELGIPVYQILGDAFGKSTAEIQEMVSKGLIPASEGIKILTNGFNELYGGAMVAQSQTFNGLLSTLKDNANLALSAFTGGIFDTAKAGLEDLGKLVSNPAFQQFAVTMGQKVGSALQSTYNFARAVAGAFQQLLPQITNSFKVFSASAAQARTWGSNIITQLGAGMMQAASYVVSIVKQIGSIIASWLRPGSPPKILPDLPEWGQAAMSEFIRGMGSPDMGVFQELSRSIGSAIKGLVTPSGETDSIGLGEQILGSRAAIAAAVSEFSQIGKVSEETFAKIAAASGEAGPAAEQLARSYFDLQSATLEVARAQEELNRVTEEYESALAPLNAELQGIRDRKKEIQDAERIKKLQEDLASGKLDEAEAELARLEIQEIGIEKQVTSVERERDAAVKAAEEKLSAAEAQQAAAQAVYDQQQQQIAIQSEQNDLIREQIGLLKQQAEAAKAAAAGGAGGGGGGAGGLDLGGLAAGGGLTVPGADELGATTGAIQELGGAVSHVKETYGEWNAEAQIAQQQLAATSQKITDVTGALFTAGPTSAEFAASLATVGVSTEQFNTYAAIAEPIITGFSDSFENISQAAYGFGVGLGIVSPELDKLANPISVVTANIGNFISTLMPLESLLTGIGAVVGGVVLSAIWSFVAGLAAAAAPVIATVAAVALLKTAWENNFLGIQEVTNSVIGGLTSFIQGFTTSVVAWWEESGAGIMATVQSQWAPVGEQIMTLMQNIGAFVGSILASMQQFWAQHGAQIMATAGQTFTTISGLIASIMGIILEVVNRVLAGITEFWNSYGGTIMSFVGGMVTFLQGQFQFFASIATGIFQGFLALLTGDTEGFVKAMQDMWSGMLDGITNMLRGLWNMISPIVSSAYDSFVEWATELGGDVVGGIIKGIGDAASGLMGSMVQLAKDALGAATGAIQAKSPSRLFANFVGAPITLGIISGIQKEAPRLFNEMANMLTELGDEASEEARKAVTKINDELNKIAVTNLSAQTSLARSGVSAIKLVRSFMPSDEDAKKAFEDVWRQGQGSTKDAAWAITNALSDQKMFRENIEFYTKAIETVRGRLSSFEQLRDAMKEAGADQEYLEAVGMQIDEEKAQIKSFEEKIESLEESIEKRSKYIEGAKAAGVSAEAYQQLQNARARAMEMAKTDADEAAKWLSMRQSQIEELARAQLQVVNAAEGSVERAMAQQELDAIKEAQRIEDILYAEQTRQRGEKKRQEYEEMGKSLADGLVEGLGSVGEKLEDSFAEIIAMFTRASGTMASSLTEAFAAASAPLLNSVPLPVYLSQAAAATSSVNTNTTNNYNYAPTYGGTPQNPSTDFAVMKALSQG